MKSAEPEFDRLAADYEKLLDDPVRQYFAPGSEFFVTRKIDVLREFAARHHLDTQKATWLDVGCGKGELLRGGARLFGRAVGCDVSLGMLEDARGVEVVAQPDPDRLPFDDASADWVTAVCIYHHIEPRDRGGLTADIRRVLRPGGVFAMIEHNPLNPATRLIVSRTPIDQHAMLLSAGAARRVMSDAGLNVIDTRFFLYVPQRLFRWAGFIERALARAPLGGQYVVFGRKQ
jgi:SAM-dependent methyltransferase